MLSAMSYRGCAKGKALPQLRDRRSGVAGAAYASAHVCHSCRFPECTVLPKGACGRCSGNGLDGLGGGVVKVLGGDDMDIAVAQDLLAPVHVGALQPHNQRHAHTHLVAMGAAQTRHWLHVVIVAAQDACEEKIVRVRLLRA